MKNKATRAKYTKMVDTQHFCLRWNNYQSSITSAFENLRDDEDFVDVTLACDGRSLKAHRVVLSACSPYFRELLKVSQSLYFSYNTESYHPFIRSTAEEKRRSVCARSRTRFLIIEKKNISNTFSVDVFSRENDSAANSRSSSLNCPD